MEGVLHRRMRVVYCPWGTSSSSSITDMITARTASKRGSGSSPPLDSACTSRLSMVSCCPFPATVRLNPAWLTGVLRESSGEAGVIWDRNWEGGGRRRCWVLPPRVAAGEAEDGGAGRAAATEAVEAGGGRVG